jgi:hypothetical protein
MPTNENPTSNYIPDRKVAERLSKHVKSLKRWDKDPRMKALGWPEPLYINGRKHRFEPALDAFLRNAALAHFKN